MPLDLAHLVYRSRDWRDAGAKGDALADLHWYSFGEQSDRLEPVVSMMEEGHPNRSTHGGRVFSG